MIVGAACFAVALACAAVNAAIYASDPGSEWNLASAIFCGGCALFIALAPRA